MELRLCCFLWYSYKHYRLSVPVIVFLFNKNHNLSCNIDVTEAVKEDLNIFQPSLSFDHDNVKYTKFNLILSLILRMMSVNKGTKNSVCAIVSILILLIIFATVSQNAIHLLFLMALILFYCCCCCASLFICPLSLNPTNPSGSHSTGARVFFSGFSFC